ncbi:MAG: class II aldolase/adducin family protein [Eubacteriales bacterium]|nr:class II aldolase/adducin family protein [Eubacteriales bacterium]MDD4327696.1 class II aldolase/adducin family protein [Eubacteriales bacterium]MDD4718095.1 class II aldolase/adducin family protein [Eubacteriales bacterium]
MRFELLHPADRLVMMMDRIYYRGMTTTSGGNLSIRDENGDVWITPSGIDKGSLTRADIMRIRPDGSIIGRHRPSVEYPFHLSVYAQRPDIGAVLHAHSPALVAFSIVRKLPNVDLIPTVSLICGKLSMAPYALPGSKELGDNISAEFAKGYSTVLLENHGVVIGSKDIFKAFMAFETLESSASLEMNAGKLGKIKPLTERKIDISRQKNKVDMPDFTPEYHSSEENEARRDLIKLIRRSYDQFLFTSTQGTYSTCLSDGSFLITPYGMDRKYLEIEDLVLIKDGQKEKGKNPSRSAALHAEIYRKHPDVKSVLVAHPPNVMAFAVTDSPFDPRTIPESYILLRNMIKVPFGSTFMQPGMTADQISDKTPALLCENDCIIVTGKSLLNAFDRLEVAEFTAKSILASLGIGDIVHIGEKDVSDIDTAFGLD